MAKTVGPSVSESLTSLTKLIHTLRSGVKRLEKSHGKVARRNARRSFGANVKFLRIHAKNLTAAVNREYPSMTEKLSAEEQLEQLAAEGRWKKLWRALKFKGRKWDKDTANAFNEYCADRAKQPARPLFVTASPYAWEIRTGGLVICIDMIDSLRWGALMVGLATYRVPSYNHKDEAFAKEILSIYKEFKFFTSADTFHRELRRQF